jgi:protein-L-isoaspartate(D-aspartate) O-methyltransferase
MSHKDPAQLNNTLISAIWKEGLVRAPGVQEAFRHVHRHLFLPGVPLERVYTDQAIPLKYDRNGFLISSCSQPTMIAIMLDQLRLKPGDNVLEIGTASGYNAALMQHIVGPQGHVTTVEIDRDLAEQAEKNLNRAKASDVRVVNADGAFGYLPRAAYDHIIATVGVWDLPPAWVRQLKDKGNLLVPFWVDGMQVSACFRKQDDGTLLSQDNRGCAFVYMRGDEAVPDMRRQVGSTSLYIVSDSAPNVDTVQLHTLLSNDYELVNIEPRLKAAEYWSSVQPYVMMNTPPPARFVLYSVMEGNKAYGLEGQGLGLILPGSAVFAPYREVGVVHAYGGSDALVLFQNILYRWKADNYPSMRHLRLRLIPRGAAPEAVETGKLVERRHHVLHIWQEQPNPS